MEDLLFDQWPKTSSEPRTTFIEMFLIIRFLKIIFVGYKFILIVKYVEIMKKWLFCITLGLLLITLLFIEL